MFDFITLIKKIFSIFFQTPYFAVILFSNFISGAFSFIGIPMLIPALQYLNKNEQAINGNKLLNIPDYILGFLGFSVNFNTVVLLAAFFLIMNQFIVFLIELLQKYVQIYVVKLETSNMIKLYQGVEWRWLVSDSSGEFQSIINREISQYSETCLNCLRLVSTFIQCLFYIVLAFVMAFKLTLISVFFFIFLIIINISVSLNIRKMSDFYNNSFIKLSSYVSGLTQNKKFLKSSGNSFHFISLILSQGQITYKQMWKVTYFVSSINFIGNILSVCFIIS